MRRIKIAIVAVASLMAWSLVAARWDSRLGAEEAAARAGRAQACTCAPGPDSCRGLDGLGSRSAASPCIPLAPAGPRALL